MVIGNLWNNSLKIPLIQAFSKCGPPFLPKILYEFCFSFIINKIKIVEI